jgi:hypothetical protein
MLDEDIQLRAFQSLKIDRNHLKLNLNQLSSLNKLESVSLKPHRKINRIPILDNRSTLFPSSIRLLCIFNHLQWSI